MKLHKSISIIAIAATLITAPILSANAATTQTKVHKQVVVYVYLTPKLTDGNPLLVAESGITKIYHCTTKGPDKGTCRAKLTGVKSYVFVRRNDFR